MDFNYMLIDLSSNWTMNLWRINTSSLIFNIFTIFDFYSSEIFINLKVTLFLEHEVLFYEEIKCIHHSSCKLTKFIKNKSGLMNSVLASVTNNVRFENGTDNHWRYLILIIFTYILYKNNFNNINLFYWLRNLGENIF